MDSELNVREPVEGSHREVVGSGIVNGELLCKVVQRVEGVARKTFLILTVAALHFAVAPWGNG